VKFRVLIADDHSVVRRGLRALVESQPDWEVCAEASNGREAVEKAHTTRPNVVVLDFAMPEMDGLTATRKILEALPDTEVLILTQHDADAVVRQVLRAGARGYILKTDAGEELVQAITALKQHKPFFTRQISEAMLSSYLRKDSSVTDDEIPVLTSREREIVKLVAEGKSNKEVADVLNITVKTAETHRANIMRKLNLGSLSELVLYAVRNHIVEP